jgi:succinyl-CoA synthetase beta subunit
VLRFLELDGDIGNCITGGGGSLTAMDTFKRYGGEPANYLDATPTQDPRKYELATVAALKSGVKGLIFGGNILSLGKTDIKARGLVDGLKRADIDPKKFPVVVRLSGPNQDRAEEILSELPGIESLGDSVTIEEAIKRVVERTENVESPANVEVDLMDIRKTQSMEVDQ